MYELLTPLIPKYPTTQDYNGVGDLGVHEMYFLCSCTLFSYIYLSLS